MGQWDKLVADYKTQRDARNAELQRRHNHDQFIDNHGHAAWQQFVAGIQTACQELTAPGASTKAVSSGPVNLVIAGGKKPVDIDFDLPSKAVAWEVRETSDKGRLMPDRRGDEFVYRDGEQILSVKDAVEFVVRKSF